MKVISTIAVAVGVISLVIGVILRLMLQQVALGLMPSSFLELSVASFLLAIALNTLGEK